MSAPVIYHGSTDSPGLLCFEVNGMSHDAVLEDVMEMRGSLGHTL